MSRRTIDAWARVAIAATLVVGFLIVLVALMTVEVPESNKDMVNAMVGALGAVGLATVVSYFFGSSSGSKSKDDAAAVELVAVRREDAGLPPIPPAEPDN